jgi:AraC-like DNA-binding protein
MSPSAVLPMIGRASATLERWRTVPSQRCSWAGSLETPSARASVRGRDSRSTSATIDRVGERHRAVALANHYRKVERLSIAQVADRLGRSPATVKAYFHDPTGGKARAVKARYRDGRAVADCESGWSSIYDLRVLPAADVSRIRTLRGQGS